MYYNIEKLKLFIGKMLWVCVLKWVYMSSLRIGIGLFLLLNIIVIYSNVYYLWVDK